MTDVKLPNPCLFPSGKVPEPLNEEERQWLALQLNQWPRRVNEARTCAIGALTNMATAEFCRLVNDPFNDALSRLLAVDHKRQREEREPESPAEKIAHNVICYLSRVRDGLVGGI